MKLVKRVSIALSVAAVAVMTMSLGTASAAVGDDTVDTGDIFSPSEVLTSAQDNAFEYSGVIVAIIVALFGLGLAFMLIRRVLRRVTGIFARV